MTMFKNRKCSKDGCTHRHHAIGLCIAHYNRDPGVIAKRKVWRDTRTEPQDQVEKRKGYLQSDRRIEASRRYNRKASRTPSGHYACLRRSAKRLGMEVGITRTEHQLIRALPCFYCGGKLAETGGGLDRIDSSKGYLLDNVFPACRPCNIMKAEQTLDEFFNRVAIIHKRNEERKK